VARTKVEQSAWRFRQLVAYPFRLNVDIKLRRL
jgi:hypothetical protein